MGGGRVTDAVWAHLDGLPNVETLALVCGPLFTDAGLEHLKGLMNLKKLDLRATNVSDEGVEKLKQALRNCKILY